MFSPLHSACLFLHLLYKVDMKLHATCCIVLNFISGWNLPTCCCKLEWNHNCVHSFWATNIDLQLEHCGICIHVQLLSVVCVFYTYRTKYQTGFVYLYCTVAHLSPVQLHMPQPLSRVAQQQHKPQYTRLYKKANMATSRFSTFKTPTRCGCSTTTRSQ